DPTPSRKRMMQHRFSLESYRQAGGKKRACPVCKQRTFVWYRDKVTGNYLSEICGRCERLDNCGYDYPPRRFFAETGQTEEWKRTRKLISSSVIERRSPVKFEIVPNEIFQASLNRTEERRVGKE